MTYLSIRNVRIDMNMQTITGESDEVQEAIFGEITDADMCVIRDTHSDEFISDLISYAKIKVSHCPGIYSRQSIKPVTGMHLDNFPELNNWAYQLAYNILPEYQNPMIDKVTLYTSGGFKIRIKTYTQIY